MSKHEYIQNQNLYGNTKVFHPDGTLMFMADNKRKNWYLNRGLAKEIENGIQLTFIPNGKGQFNNEYFLEERHNQCVCCGIKEHLTRHHVVPSQYRTLFPDHLKNRSSFDILMLCEDCHSKYEPHAQQVTAQLKKQYNIKIKNKDSNPLKVYKLMYALQNYSHTMNIDILIKKLNQLRELTDEDWTLEKIKEIKLNKVESDKGNKEAKLILENYLSDHTIEDFIIMWREHFIKYVKPQYLSENWIKQINIVS